MEKVLIQCSIFQIQNKQEKKPVTPSPASGNSTINSQSLLPVTKVIVGAPLSINIPRFYFPNGLPTACSNQEETIAKIEEVFSEFEDEKATMNEMGKIAKVNVTIALISGIFKAVQNPQICLHTK